MLMCLSHFVFVCSVSETFTAHHCIVLCYLKVRHALMEKKYNSVSFCKASLGTMQETFSESESKS